MSEIQSVIAREILDSRGNPTIEVEVATVSGVGRRVSARARGAAGRPGKRSVVPPRGAAAHPHTPVPTSRPN